MKSKLEWMSLIYFKMNKHLKRLPTIKIDSFSKKTSFSVLSYNSWKDDSIQSPNWDPKSFRKIENSFSGVVYGLQKQLMKNDLYKIIIYHTKHHTSHITHHTSHNTHHTSQFTHHTSHITHHTSHTAHITHHT